MRPLVLAVLALLAAAVPAAAAPPAPPAAPPPLTGTARAGQTLTSATGTWTGTAPLTFTRRWQRCPADGGDCAPLAATDPTHLLTDADVGATIRVLVTATNAEGAASALSAASATVAPRRPPVPALAPAITGTATDGATLTSTTGTWEGTAPITYARRWLRCDAAGEACAALTSTAATLALTAADVGATLRVEVTARNADGTASARSAPTPVVAPALPAAAAAPALTGTAKEGQLLTLALGRWTGTPALAYAQRWLRCAADGTACVPVDSAAGTAYRLVAADVGATVRAEVTATNAAGATSARTAATAVVGRGAPVALAPPEVLGPLPRDGQLYEATVGTWGGSAPLVHDRQWLRCTSAGASCVPISGEVAPEYRVRAADVGQTLRVRVTTQNAQGTAVAQSEPSPVIGASPPVSESPPLVTGTPRDGATLTASPGTWSGTGPIAHTYAWQRCDALGATCSEVPGATAATYVAGPADVGLRLRVRVGAQSGGGGAARTSEPTEPVAAAPPAPLTAPRLSGPVTEGGVLAVSTGTWSGTGPFDHEVRWQRCAADGTGCADVAGATEATLELGPDAVGATVRAVVTATNAAGSASAATAISAVVTTAPPANVVAPAVSGELRDAALLTATGGAWTGSRPLALSFRWQRCPPGAEACTDVAGATGATYRAVTADVGQQLRVVVEAANTAGSARQASARTGTILPDPPVNLEPPALSGDAQDEQVLTAGPGAWTGLVPFTTAHRWLRCDAGGEHCGEVPGAAGPTYRLGPVDVGLTIRVAVLRTNAGGTTAARSAPTAVVRPAPPRSLVRPVVRGAAGVGRTLTAEPGAWAGTPDLRFTYAWERCAPGGTGCAPIAGATNAAYAPTADDADAALRVVVRAENAAGTAVAASAATGSVADAPPAAAAPPRIEAPGLVAQGTALRVVTGAWAGDGPIDVTVRWRRCDAAAVGCVDVPGAAGETYRLAREDVGARLVAVVTATNAFGAVAVQTDPTPVVLPEPPASTTAPAITVTGGALRDGAKLTATTGRWSGAAPLTYALTWLRCDAEGEACVPVDGATGPALTLGPDDVGARLRVRVAATNAATTVEQDSAPTAVVAAAAPVPGAKPAVAVVEGKIRVGARLRASGGTFGGTAPVRVALQWQRCAGKGTGVCDDVPGATGPDLVVGEGDVGRRLRVVATGENAAGRIAAESAPTDAVPAIAPAAVAPPAVTGAAREGATLRAAPAVFSGTGPLDVTLQWERCATRSGGTCPKIAGANGAEYVPDAKDLGKFLRVTATAANAAGRASASSAPTGAVAGVAPVSTVAPRAVLAATPRVGAVVTATPGTWTGTAPIAYAFRWQRCDDARGRRCTDIPKAEKATYALVAADVSGARLRGRLRVVVTATNVAGRGVAAGRPIGRAETVRSPALATPAGRPAPRVGTIRLTRAGRLRVQVRCPRGASTCAARGTLAVGAATRAFTVRPLRAGRSRTLSLGLSAAQRAVAPPGRRVTVVVTLAGTRAGSTSTRRARLAVVRRP